MEEVDKLGVLQVKKLHNVGVVFLDGLRGKLLGTQHHVSTKFKECV